MSEENILNGLLVLVTQPELVKKNIELLQQNIRDHKDMLAKAREALKEAAAKVDENTRSESSMLAAKQQLADKMAEFDGIKLQLAARDEELKKATAELATREADHKTRLKTLDDMAAGIENEKHAHLDNVKRADAAAEKRESELGRKEALLEQERIALEQEREAISESAIVKAWTRYSFILAPDA